MPRAIDCILDQQEISIDEAFQRRNYANKSKLKYPNFLCVECGYFVKPYK